MTYASYRAMHGMRGASGWEVWVLGGIAIVTVIFCIVLAVKMLRK